MNFKGTTNIPRDQVKGIIEQFGGSWNGYTWIDQTTYLETATRDALDRMLFIESERMASCLYHPDDCESERTVIISELQGGENDPDQLLDQELTATAFKAHPYRHPTIGWLSGSADDDARRSVRLLPPLLRAEQRDAGDRRRRRHRRGAAPRRAPLRRHPAGRRRSRGCARVEPEQTGERRLTIRQEGTTAYLKVGYHAPSATDRDFFPLLILDAVLTGAKGLNLWSSFRVPPPQRSARLYRALVERGLASSVSGGADADRGSVPLHRVGDRHRRARRSRRSKRRCSRSSTACALDGITDAELAKAKAQLRARLVFDSDSVTNIAHQLGYFETIASVDLFTSAPARIAAVTLEEVAAAARAVLPPSNRTIGWFEPLPVGNGSLESEVE